VGLAVKCRQLARQVGVFIKDPLPNAMASFYLTVALEEGSTFIFGLWVCVPGQRMRLPPPPHNNDGAKSIYINFSPLIDDLVDNLDEIQLFQTGDGS
jgi:hypothetical protein